MLNIPKKNRRLMEIKQFIYILKLRPDLLITDNWTEVENQVVQEHFNRLEKDTMRNKVILAGRTLTGENPDGFGVVIFEDYSIEDARVYMNADPSVKSGIMTAELFPYRVALMRGENN